MVRSAGPPAGDTAPNRVHVVFSQPALDDLSSIWDFVAESSQDAAGDLIRELVDAGQELSELAERFPISSDVRHAGTRRRNVRTWAILYWVAPTHVEILRIVHGGRDLGRLRI